MTLISCDDMKQDKRDEAYDEEKLLDLLNEFEQFDLKKVNFHSPLDALRDYEKNMIYFEQARAVHYQLMRGLNRGLKIDDERLIKLRAKMTCMFEMQDLTSLMNHLAFEGRLDLSKNPEELRADLTEDLNEKTMVRYTASFGETEDFLKICEKGIRKEYKNRKKTIKEMHRYIARGGEDDEMPADLLKKKMDAYERNQIVYDYIHRRELRYFGERSGETIEAFNQETGQEVPIIANRMHGTIMMGKTVQEKIGVTNLGSGTGYTKLEYVKNLIGIMKSVDLKEFDHKDFAKFYDNYDRKCNALVVYTNARNLAKLVGAAMNEIREEENKVRAENGEPPLEGPLPFPDMMKDLGYANLEDLTMDMNAMQDLGNMMQGKFDSIAQTRDYGNLGYFSLQEITSLDAKKTQEMDESFERFRKSQQAEGIDIEVDGNYLENSGSVYKTVDDIKGHLEFYNMKLTTRPLSKQEKEEKKLQQRMTLNVNLSDIYQEERRSHENKRIKESRKPASAEQLATEKTAAGTQMTEVTSLYNSTQEILTSAGYKSNDEYRKLCGYTGPMAVFCGDAREKTIERVKALSVPPAQATEEQKQTMAKELESAFKVIMEFDLKKLNFKSYADLLNESYREAILMTKFCFEFNSLFDYYGELLKAHTPNLLFTEEEYLEIKAKKNFLLTAEAVYDGLPKLMMTDTCEKLDGLQILHYSDKEVVDMTKKENIKEIRQKHPEINKDDVAKLRNNASVAKEAIHTYGLLPGMDIEEMYQTKKTRLFGSPGGDAEESVKEKLSA